MFFSDKAHSIVALLISTLGIFYMLFVLIIVPILPLDENNVLHSFSPIPILLFSGLFGLVFIGSIGIFTLYVMFKSK